MTEPDARGLIVRAGLTRSRICGDRLGPIAGAFSNAPEHQVRQVSVVVVGGIAQRRCEVFGGAPVTREKVKPAKTQAGASMRGIKRQGAPVLIRGRVERIADTLLRPAERTCDAS
jgi:hypothetical protein